MLRAILSRWLVFCGRKQRHVTRQDLQHGYTEKLLTGRLRGAAYRFSKRHCPKRRFPGLVVFLRFRVQRVEIKLWNSKLDHGFRILKSIGAFPLTTFILFSSIEVLVIREIIIIL